LSEDPRFHAKVYIFGDDSAIVTSANFTTRALDSNIEAGALLAGGDVEDLIGWFDGLWGSAEPVDAPRLSRLGQRTTELRQAFAPFLHSCRLMG
jgi:phosphatidylserine/phosphatidylglycerophosphate/cardiolipin synthase-like enzyme